MAGLLRMLQNGEEQKIDEATNAVMCPKRFNQVERHMSS